MNSGRLKSVSSLAGLERGLGSRNKAGLTQPKAADLWGTGQGPSVYLYFAFGRSGCGR